MAEDPRDQQRRQDWEESLRNPEENSPFTDLFAGQDVSGPEQGAWGSAGTPAAGMNQSQLSTANAQTVAGNKTAGNMSAMGDAAQKTASADAWTARDAAQSAELRDNPTASYTAAEAADARSLAARGGTQSTLAALDQFAGQQGQGPSAAQAAGQGVINQGLNQQLALAKSGRGFGGGAAAMGQAAGNMAAVTAAGANQAAQTRAAEDQAAKQRQLAALNASLGGGLQQQGVDQSAAQDQVGRSQFDANLELQSRGQNDQTALGNRQLALANVNQGNGAQLGFEGLGQGTQLQREQLGLGHEELGQHALDSQADYELQQQQMELDAQKANQATDTERDSSMMGTVGSIAGGLMMFSDERLKEIEGREKALADALGTLGEAPGYSYKYKRTDLPGTAPGRQVSSMAQDLEKGPHGDDVVTDTPNGKMVDYSEVMKLTPGAITELNRKVKALEAALGKAA
jgi:hypothetical protein